MGVVIYKKIPEVISKTFDQLEISGGEGLEPERIHIVF
jgi:hypothetical protein